MAEYKVVRQFKEVKHKGHIYKVGDKYPAEGHKIVTARAKQLATRSNKYNQIFIESSTIEED